MAQLVIMFFVYWFAHYFFFSSLNVSSTKKRHLLCLPLNSRSYFWNAAGEYRSSHFVMDTVIDTESQQNKAYFLKCQCMHRLWAMRRSRGIELASWWGSKPRPHPTQPVLDLVASGRGLSGAVALEAVLCERQSPEATQ